jgi:hypothetical protein
LAIAGCESPKTSATVSKAVPVVEPTVGLPERLGD